MSVEESDAGELRQTPKQTQNINFPEQLPSARRTRFNGRPITDECIKRDPSPGGQAEREHIFNQLKTEESTNPAQRSLEIVDSNVNDLEDGVADIVPQPTVVDTSILLGSPGQDNVFVGDDETDENDE
ncbi:hypothetical protein ACHAQH_009340 [Verticillium albo-atrum]